MGAVQEKKCFIQSMKKIQWHAVWLSQATEESDLRVSYFTSGVSSLKVKTTCKERVQVADPSLMKQYGV